MRLNLGNETELYLLAADLRCCITDLYVAVASVGDKLEDVKRFVAKKIHGQEANEIPRIAA